MAAMLGSFPIVTIASTVNVTLTVTVPDRDIIDLAETASSGGINYWAQALEIDERARTVKIWVSDPDPDDEIPVKRTLSFDWIAKRLVQLGTGQEIEGHAGGYAGLRVQAARYIAELMNSEIDHDLDAEVADVVMQLAYFNGKVIFG